MVRWKHRVTILEHMVSPCPITPEVLFVFSIEQECSCPCIISKTISLL